MDDKLVFLFIGGVLGYVGTLLQSRLETKRQKASEIRQEKIRIYSSVLTELGSLFMDPENIANEINDPAHMSRFVHQLGKILAPARLVADDRLEKMLRELYDKEILWHDTFASNASNKDQLAKEATQIRMQVEREMRRELKS